MTREAIYSAYERIWHWTQALCIVVLIVTGAEIHWPDSVRLLGFERAARVHTASGFLLLINAFLGFFYYLTTGEIRQLIPRVRGLFSDMSAQARYYLGGILRGEEHPFHRRPEARLNPLQRLTYLGLLNVLLPLQIGTGVLIRSAEEWGAVDGFFGGLRVLALIHTIGAWLLTAFLLAHLYLITTGRSPSEHLKSMVSGLGESHLDPRKEQGP